MMARSRLNRQGSIGEINQLQVQLVDPVRLEEPTPPIAASKPNITRLILPGRRTTGEHNARR